MQRPLTSALALITALAAGGVHSADNLLTFEEAGFTAMGNTPGAVVPIGSRLHNQFLATLGVSFASGAGFVAVVNHGCCTASVPNVIGGTSAGGGLNYSVPITITFYDPGHTASAGVTDLVRIRGDFTSIPGSATMRAFGVGGALLASVSETDNAAGVDMTIAMAGIHSIVLTQTSATIGFDNLEFNTVTAVPEPGTAALSALGLGWLALRIRRRVVVRPQAGGSVLSNDRR